MIRSTLARPRASTILYFSLAACLASFLSACTGQTPAATPNPPPAAQATPAAAPASASPSATPGSPLQAQSTASAARALGATDFLAQKTLSRGYLTTPNELRRIAALAGQKQEPYHTAVKQELAYAQTALGEWNEDVPDTLKFSDDIDKPKYLSVGA